MRVDPVSEHIQGAERVDGQLEGARDLRVGVCDIKKEGCRCSVLGVGLGEDTDADLRKCGCRERS